MANGDRLVLEEVTKTYRGQDGSPLTVLRGVSCAIAAGETVAITGPSGSGKSTLLNLIGGLDRPTAGRIVLGGVDVTALTGKSLAAYRARRVGFVFQDHHLLPQLSALENVLVPTLAEGGDRGARGRAQDLLARVGLSGRARAFPAQLSGGERQRVALCRALINGPRLLLCDEPTGDLDRITGASIITLLLEIAADRHTTVLMVTHNAEHAARMGRWLQLRDGTLLPATPGDNPGGGV